MQADLLKSSIKKFGGEPTEFKSWSSKVSKIIEEVNFSPLQMLQFMESNSTGAAQRLITSHLSALGEVTNYDVYEVWVDLKRIFGSVAVIARDLFKKMDEFPVIKGEDITAQLGQMLNLCRLLHHNIADCSELEILDRPSGLRTLRSKLPTHIQKEWSRYGQLYERRHNGRHPHFEVFMDFIKEQTYNSSNINYEIIRKPQAAKSTKVLLTEVCNTDAYEDEGSPASAESHFIEMNPVHVNYNKSYVRQSDTAKLKIQEEVTPEEQNLKPVSKDTPNSGNKSAYNNLFCVYHKRSGHRLRDCKGFTNLPYEKRKMFAYENSLCYKCLGAHKIKDCKSTYKCKSCNKTHADAMHREVTDNNNESKNRKSYDNSENSKRKEMANCLTVCGSEKLTRQCGKTVLVDVNMPQHSDRTLRCDCILDDQASTSLVDKKLVDYFNLSNMPIVNYQTKFANSGSHINVVGHKISNITVKGVLESKSINVREALTFPDIVDTRH